jgi:formate dehydrogenase major subunit
MTDLLNDYDAVLVSTGCYEANRLGIPGESLDGVYSGLNFMVDVCSGLVPVVGKRVLVIGAGFTAFDCARSSLRLGAADVTICLRRTEADLAVEEEEVVQTKREGVKIDSLMLSRRILGEGAVHGVEFVRTQPGDRGQSGKTGIRPIEGSEFELQADTVIVATGQRPVALDAPGEKNDDGILLADKAEYRTSVDHLYVAGDYLTGPSTVIEAVAMGRWAAEKIAGDLTGRRFRKKAVRMEDARITDRERTWDFIPRQEMPTIENLEDRFAGMDKEVETGYSPEAAQEEAKRCYLCYLHYEIDIDRCIYCRYCIDVAPRDCIKLVEEVLTNDLGAVTGLVETKSWRDVNAIVIDNARCIRCGECVRVCPVDCISVTKVERIEHLPEGDVYAG